MTYASLAANRERQRLPRPGEISAAALVRIGSTLAPWPPAASACRLDEELIRRARQQDIAAPEKSDAQVVEDALAVYLGMKALDDARAQGTLAPEEADRLAVEEVRAVRQARRRRPA